VPGCRSCGSENPVGYRFCGQCGEALAAAGCPACGAANPPGQPFCGQCGAPLGEQAARPPAPAPAADERKLATVLFADVVGFTTLAERTDHEVVARLVDAAFRRLAEVVVEHGGTVDKYMGDSVMAVFGVPVAHDDDAERAVAAGLAMRNVTGDLAFSIGINSGEVTATAVAGTTATTVIGDVVNVAARLEKVAGPGEVLCGRLTAELAGHRVEFREREPVLLKGKAQPVEVRQAIAMRAPGSAPAGLDVPLVGREDELAFLVAQWRRVCRDRRPHFLLLCGDAGSGKTRLLDELAQLAAADGTVVRSSYPAYGAMGGARVAADIAGQLGPIDDPQVAARIRAIAGDLDPSLQTLDPAAMRQEQTWAFGRLILRCGAESPLMIVIDDMHRSGERTLEMLGDLSVRLGDLPLLAVLAGRTEPGGWLSRFPAATTIRLSPLDRAHAATLADAFARDKPLTPETRDFFVDRAGGNPLYVRELVTMARAQGALVDDGGRYRLSAHAAVPATLHALLAARLDALDPVDKQVLQHLSILGEAVDGEGVGKLGTPGAAGALRSLADAGLVSERPDGRYETVDPLLREVAYETLPRHVRGELHRRAAALAGGAEERARHLDRVAEYLTDDAAAAAEAAEALARAAEELIDVARHLDALALLERAAAIGPIPTSSRFALARIQLLVGREEAALATLEGIADDPDEPSVAVERDHTAANSMTFRDPVWAVPRLLDAAERWHALGDVSKEAWARANAGVAWFNQSRLEESAAELTQALALFTGAGDRWGAVNTGSFLALVTPTDRKVTRWLAEALELADSTGDRTRQTGALTTLMWHHFFRSFCGSPQEMAVAEGFALRLALLSEELGADELAIQARALLAIMTRFTGRLGEAAEHVAALHRSAGRTQRGEPWLGWAASFAVTVAGGGVMAAAPYPPGNSLDPVSGVAKLVIEIALTMVGRGAEVVTQLEAEPRGELGPFGELAGLLNGLTLQLAGRGDDAQLWVRRAIRAAQALDAGPAAIGAAALAAEIAGDTADLAPMPETAASISDLLVLRAHAAGGDTVALRRLRSACEALAMPALGRIRHAVPR
jgi:class 3 adenylate cyclase/tetratricopeptide (TPR) repeat protein